MTKLSESTISPYSFFFYDGRLFYRKYTNYLIEAVRKLVPEAYSDDLFVLNRSTLGFKTNITKNKNWDPKKFEEILADRYDPEFLQQWVVENDKMICLNKYIKLSLGSIPELPFFIEIDEDDPNYNDYYETYKKYGPGII